MKREVSRKWLYFVLALTILGVFGYIGQFYRTPEPDYRHTVQPIQAISPLEAEKPYAFDENRLFNLVNDYRAKNGVSKLVRLEALNISADYKCDDMLENAYWSHDNPDTGETPFDIIKRYYTYENAGENLTNSIKNEQEALENWKNSPTHNEAMLDSVYTVSGIAICSAGKRAIAIQHFAN